MVYMVYLTDRFPLRQGLFTPLPKTGYRIHIRYRLGQTYIAYSTIFRLAGARGGREHAKTSFCGMLQFIYGDKDTYLLSGLT